MSSAEHEKGRFSGYHAFAGTVGRGFFLGFCNFCEDMMGFPRPVSGLVQPASGDCLFELAWGVKAVMCVPVVVGVGVACVGVSLTGHG